MAPALDAAAAPAADVRVARLPARWADEMARMPERTRSHPGSQQLGLEPTNSLTPPSRPVVISRARDSDFDARLDDFLARFHEALIVARSAKDAADSMPPSLHDARKDLADAELRERMRVVTEMYEIEGQEFAQVLEKRDPSAYAEIRNAAQVNVRASQQGHAKYGENTLELARGIERLERAVTDEERKRLVEGSAGDRDAATSRRCGDVRGSVADEALASRVSAPANRRLGSDPLERPTTPHSIAPGPALHDYNARLRWGGSLPAGDTTRGAASNFASEPSARMGLSGSVAVQRVEGSNPPSLSTLHSDETLCLMQSDIKALKLELMRLQRSKAGGGKGGVTLPRLSPPEVPFTTSTVSPVHTSHDLDAAADCARVVEIAADIADGTSASPEAPPRYVSHLEHMKSRLDALEQKPLSRATRHRSAVRIGRTRTMTNLYSTSTPATPAQATRPPDENSSESVQATTTPPRSVKRADTSSSPVSFARREASMPASLAVVRTLGDDDFHSTQDTLSSASTPTRIPTGEPAVAPQQDSTEQNLMQDNQRLLRIDAPEDMLSKPQSHAAAQDIQRYSLKVARRLGPVPGSGGGGDGISVGVDTESSAASVPVQRALAHEAQKLHPQAKYGHTKSEIIPSTFFDEDSSGGAPAPIEHRPSTLDTVISNGSSGPVVEEMEGDLWVRKGNLWKRWRKRYASIVTHQFFGRVLCLFSYDTNGNVISSKSEVIVLSQALCRALRETAEIGNELHYVLVLRTGKEYYFAVNSDATRRKWIKELRQAARLEISRAPPVPVAPPTEATPVRTKRATASSRLAPIGRAATHTGGQQTPVSQSGPISGPRIRRTPFRRILNN